MWKIDSILSLTGRRWLYGVATAAIPLLIAVGAISDEQAPLWVALIGAVLVPGVALSATVPDTSHAVIPPAVAEAIIPDDDSIDMAIIDPEPRHGQE
ncbi:hypothetical protein FYJ43_07690 [Cutibacterium sp. WCA-380-WT-3A]|uniref:Holin n=1 Tax=Cutibacterium porci TaxID=2605781 RepID=A0A7K0J7J2_9ACTN|nr:hypothetical protein [Cutibacterium porci]MSS45920.1 hypothetical protein [Cutibacterium porci]